VSDEEMVSKPLSDETIKMEDIAIIGKGKDGYKNMLIKLEKMRKNLNHTLIDIGKGKLVGL
jgi:hypothetical protein